jgi:hypothetical protein
MCARLRVLAFNLAIASKSVIKLALPMHRVASQVAR